MRTLFSTSLLVSRWLGLTALSVIIIGCQTEPSAPPEPVARKDSIIRFDEGFAWAFERHYVQRDPGTGNAFYIAEFRDTATAGTIVASRLGRSYVVEYRPTQRYVQSLFEEELTWEGSGTSRSHFGPTEYRFFRIHGDVRHCVGFSATAGVTYEDARERAHDLVYGYFCSQGLSPITGADAERYIGSILIKN